MGIVFIIILIAAAVLILSFLERRSLKAEYYTYVNVNAPGSLRIAFLTDIHDRLRPRDIELITKCAAKESPDLILIGGDVFTLGRYFPKKPDLEAAVSLLKALRKTAPVIYGEGNHELRLRELYPEAFEDYLAKLSEIDVDYIAGKTREILGLSVSGAALPSIVYDKKYLSIGDPGKKSALPRGFLREELPEPAEGTLRILLMHSPLYIREAHDWGADLVLSGHFHGGTVRLPLFGGLMTPQYHFFLRETAGFFRYENTVMIVSRGIGTHGVRLRLNDLPELCIVDVRAVT